MSDYKPYLVSWNLTGRCNLACPHCYINSSSPELQTPNPELTSDEARSVIDELRIINPRLMLVLSGGEPMLREDIFDIVEYADRCGFITVMGSNGTLLTEENIRVLKEAGLKGLGISIDSPSPMYHDLFRGSEGAWKLSTNALRYAKDIGIETQIDVTLTDKNWEEIDNFIEFGVSYGAKAVNFFFLVCTGRAMKTDISTASYEAALKTIARLSARERRLMVRARCAPHIYRVLYEEGVPISSGTRGCLAGRYYMRIDHEGNVTPCPYMSVTAGNIREHTLSSIWGGASSLSSLRDGVYSGRCGICEYAEICGGCRARALMENGDFMGEDPLCSYIPSGKSRVIINDSFNTDMQWDEKARERLRNVPNFMQGMIIRMVETVARDRGVEVVTNELMDEMKGKGYKVRHFDAVTK
ncbi:MAG: radical SAM protein [Nitrospirota bacterium]|mgnify:CR=1 FL=1